MPTVISQGFTIPPNVRVPVQRATVQTKDTQSATVQTINTQSATVRTGQ